MSAIQQIMIAGIGGSGSSSAMPNSVVMDLDATQSGSYSGSGQTFSNLISSPADGAAQTDYDYYLGSTSGSDANDPTFTGSAGTSGAYFSHASSQYFSLKSGANTTFFKNMPKTTGGSPWWFAIAGRTKSSIGYGSTPFFGDSSGQSDGIGIGIVNGIDSRVTIYQAESGSQSSVTFTTGLNTNQDFVIIISADPSQPWPANNIYCWSNNRTGTANAFTWRTGNNDASDPMALARLNDVSGGAGHTVNLGTEGIITRGFSAGNAFITDTDAAKIFNAYNSRHALTYA